MGKPITKAPAKSLEEFLEKEFTRALERYTSLWQDLQKHRAVTPHFRIGFDLMVYREVKCIREEACKYWGSNFVADAMSTTSEFTYEHLGTKSRQAGAQAATLQVVK